MLFSSSQVHAPATTEEDFVDFIPATHLSRSIPDWVPANEDYQIRACEEVKLRHKQFLEDRALEFAKYRRVFDRLEGVCVICAELDGKWNGPDHAYADCPFVSKDLVIWANTVRGNLELSKVDTCYTCMLSSLGQNRFHKEFTGSFGESAANRGCVLPNFVLGMALLMKMDFAFPWKADFQKIVHRTGWFHAATLVGFLGRKNDRHSSNGMAMLYAYGGAKKWMN